MQTKSLSLKGAAIIFLIVVAAIVTIGSVMTSSHLTPSRNAPQESPAFAFNPIQQLQQWLTPKSTNPPSSSPAPTEIKVVSEESQVIDVVKKSTGAVVSIVASSDVPKMERCVQQMPGIEGLPPEFQQMMQVQGLCQNGTQKQRTSAGSGFLVSADGYILTNRHVVQDEQSSYTVVLNDDKHSGQKFPAKILARDAINDIAVLKIEGSSDLPFLSFGDSTKLQVGQTAIAIGYALGEFDNTVSRGVVSGLSRSIRARDGITSEQLRGLIQTDAAINPGNSGGPLLDIGGNVIGMNTAVADGQSIGFAIPINTVKDDYLQVQKTGKITEKDHAYLGVRFLPVTTEMKDTNNLPVDYGMLVAPDNTPNALAVVPGSPADKAGIQQNDIILDVDGKQLNEKYLLSDAIDAHTPGDMITLKIYHKGDTKTLQIKLEKRPTTTTK
jgi:serine protease Do